MKKNLLILIFIFLLLIILPFSNSQVEDIIEDAEKGEKILRGISEKDIKSEYLSKEWTKIFREKKTFNWIYKFNPLFKFLFGYDFSFSWAFVTAFLIWLIIFSLFFPQVKLIFSQTFSSLGISIAISSIAANYLAPKTIDYLSSIVKDIWDNLIVLIFLIILLILVFYLSKLVSKKMKKILEERKAQKSFEASKKMEKIEKEIKQ